MISRGCSGVIEIKVLQERADATMRMSVELFRKSLDIYDSTVQIPAIRNVAMPFAMRVKKGMNQWKSCNDI
jgi:hypothetical protein